MVALKKMTEQQQEKFLNGDVKLKLKALRKQLNAIFFERSELIDLYLAALISNYSVFVGGPPGTGKTYLANVISDAFEAKSCYRLLQASSTLEEIIGAVDLAALDKGVFKRKLDGGAVTSDVLILDEGFKSNSTVLNALLGLILDKAFFNGDDGFIKSPLKLTVVCSNELPQDESLAPFWDRLVIRYWVEGLRPENKIKLLTREANGTCPIVTVKFTLDELEQLKKDAQQLKIDGDIIKALVDISEYLKKECGIIVSDRKLVQILEILKAYAIVLGKDSVDDECLELVKHSFWDEPKQIEKIQLALNKFGNPAIIKAKQYYEASEALYNSLPKLSITTKTVTEPDGSEYTIKDNFNAGEYRIKADTVGLKIQEYSDLLSGELAKKKNQTVENYLRKINGFIESINESIRVSLGLKNS